MKVDVLLGLQWGDEGKGKVVDVLTPRYDAVARFQGGPNAGHTLEFEGKKYVLRSIPSGIFQQGQINIIGNGVVLDPVLFKEEAEALERSGVALKRVLKISKKAHLIMPTHRLLDAANEKRKGALKIGTTGKGIGRLMLDTLIDLLKLQNIRNVYSCITHPNIPSEHLHETMGFRKCATFHHSGFKHGKWYDTLWYEKQIASATGEQPEAFLPFHRVEREAVRQILEEATLKANLI